MQKAFLWLAKNNLDYTFHNFKTHGLDEKIISHWLEKYDVESIVNKKGTTFRGLTDTEKRKLAVVDAAKKIMIQHPSVIKRPIVEYGGDTLVGFNEQEWQFFFKK